MKTHILEAIVFSPWPLAPLLRCYLSFLQNPHGKPETETPCGLLEFYKEDFLRNVLASSLHACGTWETHPRHFSLPPSLS